jgi:hypothetical protein
MNFLKTMFAMLFAHRVLSVLVTIVIGAIIFFMISDIEFVNKLFDGTTKWIDENSSNIAKSVGAFIENIFSKFKQN